MSSSFLSWKWKSEMPCPCDQIDGKKTKKQILNTLSKQAKKKKATKKKAISMGAKVPKNLLRLKFYELAQRSLQLGAGMKTVVKARYFGLATVLAQHGTNLKPGADRIALRQALASLTHYAIEHPSARFPTKALVPLFSFSPPSSLCLSVCLFLIFGLLFSCS
jgi:hypothetical protein